MYLAHINHETHRKQTLTEHSKTVSALSKKYGEGIGCPNLAELCGILHDMGKAKQEFQEYLRIDDPDIRKLYHGKINHSSAGAKYIFEKYEKSTDKFERYTAQIIALAICSHHSGLTDCIDPEGHDLFLKRINPEKEIYFEESTHEFETECISPDELDTLFRKSVDEVRTFNEKNKSRNAINGAEIAFTRGMITRYLLSCVIDADRYDSFCFEDELVTKDVPDISIETWKKLGNNLDEYLDNKPLIYDIDELRTEISNSCKAFGKKTGGIYRLNVPTGGGKTLSSLRYALAHAAEWNKNRIFYVIPFTTIIDQNAAVIRDALREDDLILEHHSNLVYEEPINEADSGDTDIDEEKNYRLLTERWDSPIILTTTVQMLNTLFLDKTSSVRRMHNLANSIIIFDEVQAIPIKCLSMFNAALNFLSEICGTTIILCTATQPKLTIVKPPLRLSNPADMVAVDFEKFRRTNVCDARVLPSGYTAPDLADFVLDKLQNNTKILVILNTKTAVKNLYTQLSTKKISDFTSRNDFSLYYLSTNLCSAHRQKRLEIIRANLEKENLRMICVSTQLIEAGVDISFDCVIRSIAGIDSIAQASGRCNRHGKVLCREVFIVNSSDEKLSGLKDIDSGKKSAEYVLSNYRKNPAEFNNDVLSQKMIDLYYQKYFYSREKEMGYLITKDMITKKKLNIPPGDSIYNLLSINEKSLQAYNTIHNKDLGSPYYLCQAFSTAGKLFEVIDQNSTTVIVPYDEGIGIIRDLGTHCSYAEKLRLLKKAQQYSVNLYGDLEQLLNMGNISPIGDTGAYTLNTSSLCYDEEYGVISPSEREYLF